MEYRQQALAKVHAGDELGTPLQLTAPHTWVVLVVLLMLVGAGGAWAAVGTLPRKLTAPGIFTHRLGAYTVYGAEGGWISQVWVQQGQTVAAGAPVLALTQGATTTVVRAPAPGQVIEVLAAVGQYITVGAVLARVDAMDPDDQRLVAVLYVPAGSGAAIRSGAQVDLYPQPAPGIAGGLLRGRVTSVGQVPQTRAQIGQFLGDDELADRFATPGLPIKVVVSLTGPASLVDGVASPAGGAAGYRITSRTLVTGAVHLPDIHPIEWLLPG